jgi:hypothetical protein
MGVLSHSLSQKLETAKESLNRTFSLKKASKHTEVNPLEVKQSYGAISKARSAA